MISTTFDKNLKRVNKAKRHLLFASLLLVLVQLTSFEKGKRTFNWAARIRIRSRDDRFQLCSRQEGLHQLTSVVWRSVAQKDRVFAPTRRFVVQEFGQSQHETHDYRAVRVALAGRPPELAVRADGHYHRKAWSDRLLRPDLLVVLGPPLFCGIGAEVQPSLIQIDDSLTFSEQFQQRERVLLPEDEALLGVDVFGADLDFSESHTLIVTHDSADELLRARPAIYFDQPVLYHRSIHDRRLKNTKTSQYLLNSLDFDFSGSFLLDDLSKGKRVVPHFLDQVSNGTSAHEEFLGDVLVSLVLFIDSLDYLLAFCDRNFVEASLL